MSATMPARHASESKGGGGERKEVLKGRTPSPARTRSDAFGVASAGEAAGGRAAGKGLEEMRSVLRTLQLDLEDETSKRREAEAQLSALQASKSTLAGMSLDALTALETTLEASMRAVRASREAKMTAALGDEVSRALCSVCLTRPKNMLFLPCKHLCACSDCAGRIMRGPPSPADPAEAARLAAAGRKEPQCPICRVPVQQVLDVYA
jgi:hypothetical protein